MVVIPRYPLESHVASFAEEGYLIWFCRSPERTEEPQCLIAGTAAQGTEPSQSSCASGASACSCFLSVTTKQWDTGAVESTKRHPLGVCKCSWSEPVQDPPPPRLLSQQSRHTNSIKQWQKCPDFIGEKKPKQADSLNSIPPLNLGLSTY